MQKLRNTDMNRTIVVVSEFSRVSSFKFLVVDNINHCIDIVNREDNSNIVFAGSTIHCALK